MSDDARRNGAATSTRAGDANAKPDQAAVRTDLAEDRTLLANERTYASWMRTGMASVAVALGFRALLRDFEPVWVVKAIAIVFALVGAAVIWFAFKRACAVSSELNSHEIRSLPLSRMRWLSSVLVVAAIGVAVALGYL